MIQSTIIRNPILRKKSQINAEITIPDLAYEISEQDLSAEASGGTSPATPPIASLTVSIAIYSVVAESFSLKEGRDWT